LRVIERITEEEERAGLRVIKKKKRGQRIIKKKKYPAAHASNSVTFMSAPHSSSSSLLSLQVLEGL